MPPQFRFRVILEWFKTFQLVLQVVFHSTVENTVVDVVTINGKQKKKKNKGRRQEGDTRPACWFFVLLFVYILE